METLFKTQLTPDVFDCYYSSFKIGLGTEGWFVNLKKLLRPGPEKKLTHDEFEELMFTDPVRYPRFIAGFRPPDRILSKIGHCLPVERDRMNDGTVYGYSLRAEASALPGVYTTGVYTWPLSRLTDYWFSDFEVVSTIERPEFLFVLGSIEITPFELLEETDDGMKVLHLRLRSCYCPLSTPFNTPLIVGNDPEARVTATAFWTPLLPYLENLDGMPIFGTSSKFVISSGSLVEIPEG